MILEWRLHGMEYNMEWRLQALLMSLHLPTDSAAVSQTSWTSVLSSSRAWFHSSLLHIHSQAQSVILMSLHTWLHLSLPCQHCLASVPGLPRYACFNYAWTVNIENVGGLELRLHCHRCFCHNIITSCISVPSAYLQCLRDHTPGSQCASCVNVLQLLYLIMCV